MLAIFQALSEKTGLDGRPPHRIGLPGNKVSKAGGYGHVGYRRA
jgi:hypothetical protein